MCRTSEEERDVLQLRDVVLPVAALLDEQRPVLQVLSAGVTGVQLGQLSEDHAPRPDLLRGVLDAGDGLTAGEGEELQLHVIRNHSRDKALRSAKAKFRKKLDWISGPEASTFKLFHIVKLNLQLIIHGHLHKVLPPLTVDFIFESLTGSSGRK